MLDPAEVALLFDLDNTLIHSTIDFATIRRRLIAMLRDVGITAPDDAALMRHAIPELVDVGAQADPTLPERMWQAIREIEDAGMASAGLVEHADAVLAQLAARGFRLGLLTNSSRGGTEERLRALGLHAHFQALATRDHVTRMKPQPDGVHYLLGQLAGIRRAYVIGDSWIDGRAAEAAGARFIGFGSREAEVRDRGITVWAWITDLRELLGLDLAN
ncbi:MAG TPA: HAD-IA family hydrolase [bacterium]